MCGVGFGKILAELGRTAFLKQLSPIDGCWEPPPVRANALMGIRIRNVYNGWVVIFREPYSHIPAVKASVCGATVVSAAAPASFDIVFQVFGQPFLFADFYGLVSVAVSSVCDGTIIGWISNPIAIIAYKDFSFE